MNKINKENTKQPIILLDEYEKAIECYNHALQLSSDRSTIDIYIKGFALRKLGDYQQAIMYFNKAKSINPKYKDNTWSVQGHNLTVLGKYKQAIECYDNSLEIDPDDARTWKEKGDCLSKAR